MNGVTTKYTLFGDKVFFETTGSDKIHYSYDASGNLFSMNLNGSEYYYTRNAQGDITGLIDGAKNQVVSYTYDTWGKLLTTTGSLAGTLGVKNPYRYRGYRYDTETGLYYLQSRYYNPDWGRFVNADSTIDQDAGMLGLNLYAYTANNPINYKDVTGESITLTITIVYAAIISGTALLAVLNLNNPSTRIAWSQLSVQIINGMKSSLNRYTSILIGSGVLLRAANLANKIARADANIRARVKRAKNNVYRFFEISFAKNVPILGKPLTEHQAITRARRGLNVITYFATDAVRVANLAGNAKAQRHQRHDGGDGFFNHHHLYDHSNSAHVFYIIGG